MKKIISILICLLILSVTISTVCAEQYKPAHGPDTRICTIQEHHLSFEDIIKQESSIPADISEEIPVSEPDYSTLV